MTAVPTPIAQVPPLQGDRSPILADAIAQLIASEPELASITLSEFASRARSAGTRSAPDRLLTPVPSTAVAPQDIGHLLSERELEVVRLVSEGLSNKDISHRLGLSDKTVKNHISHILAKLNLTARTQVAVLAIRGGFA